jgi:hypothetical protein
MLPDRLVDAELTQSLGREVVKIEVLPLSAGQHIQLRLEKTGSRLRQGVWFGVNGVLRVGEVTSSQMQIWRDTAPPLVDLLCEASGGLLHFYNIWRTPDSGLSPGNVFSLLGNSGMLVDELPGGWRRYSCSHSAPEADFSRLVFQLRIG